MSQSPRPNSLSQVIVLSLLHDGLTPTQASVRFGVSRQWIYQLLARYKEGGLEAASDLVISRSGAVTVTETGVLGIYTLYVPLPIGNGEQAENAKVVTESGGGEIIKNAAFTSEWLLANAERLMLNAKNYSSSGARLNFPLDASSKIASRALQVINHE